MSTAAVSPSSVQQHLPAYFQERGADQKALGVALRSGDLAGAQQQFNAIQSLAQNGPFASSGSPTANAYKITQRQQDFAAIGQALQAGDLAGAQAAFAQLQATFHKASPSQPQQQAEPSPAVVVNIGGQGAPSPSSSSGATSQSTPAGGEIVLNLGNITSGEQITIGVRHSSNGGEQVTIGVANQANQAPEQVTLNLNQNSNQEIVLNLFNSTSNSATPGSSINATA
jgi:hypothetical protein